MCERTHRAVASAGVWAIIIAAAAIPNHLARAETNSQIAALSILDAVPSQDLAGGDELPVEPKTRVAQFFPFFSLFEQHPQQRFEQRPQVRPPVAPPARIEERNSVRRQADNQSSRTPKTMRRSSAEALKDRIGAQLRNPPTIQPTKGPLLLTVSIAKQTITLYDGGVQIAKAPVSTGTESNPTPMGVFSVVEKEWWHRSNMYSAAPMPFMQRITWSGVALHAGELPGYRASHGCVRLPESFALRLWYTTRVGVRVVVAWNELTPAAIDHPLLFQPSPIPLPPVRETPPLLAPPQSDEVVMGMNDPAAASQDDPTDQAGSVAESVSPNQPSPVQEETVDVAGEAELDHMMMAVADDGAGIFDEPVATADAGDIVNDDRLPLIPAKLEVTDILRPKPAIGVFDIARRKIVRSADAARSPSPEIDVEAVLRPGPISVLISRKDRKIYVRKGLQPVFAMPVTIAETERAWGTHVFTAVAANEDGSRLNWMTVSPTAEPLDAAALRQPTAAARAALDRISIPQEVTNRITPLLSVGATLILTDSGLGRTAAVLDSDFTVLLRPEVIAAKFAPAPRRHTSENPPRRELFENPPRQDFFFQPRFR